MNQCEEGGRILQKAKENLHHSLHQNTCVE